MYLKYPFCLLSKISTENMTQQTFKQYKYDECDPRGCQINYNTPKKTEPANNLYEKNMCQIFLVVESLLPRECSLHQPTE